MLECSEELSSGKLKKLFSTGKKFGDRAVIEPSSSTAKKHAVAAAIVPKNSPVMLDDDFNQVMELSTEAKKLLAMQRMPRIEQSQLQQLASDEKKLPSEFLADDGPNLSALNDSNFNISLSPDIIELLTARGPKDKSQPSSINVQKQSLVLPEFLKVEQRDFQARPSFGEPKLYPSESPVLYLDRGEDARISLRRS